MTLNPITHSLFLSYTLLLIFGACASETWAIFEYPPNAKMQILASILFSYIPSTTLVIELSETSY